MITANRIHLRARRALHQWQARRLLARINRRQARAQLDLKAGYDELKSPVFIAVMVLAVLVLVVDISDAWPRVDSAVASLITIAVQMAGV
jgi:hypothetical protein